MTLYDFALSTPHFPSAFPVAHSDKAPSVILEVLPIKSCNPILSKTAAARTRPKLAHAAEAMRRSEALHPFTNVRSHRPPSCRVETSRKRKSGVPVWLDRGFWLRQSFF
jgi:hypothetical protein